MPGWDSNSLSSLFLTASHLKNCCSFVTLIDDRQCKPYRDANLLMFIYAFKLAVLPI